MDQRAIALPSPHPGVLAVVSVAIVVAWGAPGTSLVAAERAGGSGAKRGPTAVASAVTIAQVEEAILAHVREHLGHLGTVQVELLDPPDALPVSPAPIQLRVLSGGPDEALGRRQFVIALETGGYEHDRIKVAADVSVIAQVVTAARALRPDDVLEPEDLSITPVRLRTARHDFLTDAGQAVGKRVLKPVSAGAPIRAAALTEPYSVKKGDRVTIEAKRGGLTIHAVGITKSSGKIGQIVAVTNQDSGREIRARVAGPGLVQVDF